MVRILVFLVLSLALAWEIYFRFDQTNGNDGIPTLDKTPAYLPYFPAWLFPLFVVILPALHIPVMGVSQAFATTLSIYGGLFIQISLYHLLLLALRPLLHRYISARTTALLWIFPNLLYLAPRFTHLAPARPRYAIALPHLPWHWLLWVWLAGCVGVLGWYIGQHLRFRRRILAPARPVTDTRTLEIWAQTLQEVDFSNPRCQMVISPAVSTPLSIGLFPRSTRVVLPPHSYTPEELHWLLRHEAIHLARQDSWTKFSLLFCTAICWFNPLMWVAMKTCAQDLELSCDETVLLFAHQPHRKEYAALLLRTAGDARGFTTCLSASTSTLRQRLKQILSPSVRSSGALVVSVSFFLLSVFSGWLTLSHGSVSGAEALSLTGEVAQYSVIGIHVEHPHYKEENVDYALSNPQAFQSYLSSLTLSPLVGTYTFPDQQRDFYCFLTGSQEEYLLAVTGDFMEVTVLGRGGATAYYYLPQGFDWDHLMPLLEATPSTYT